VLTGMGASKVALRNKPIDQLGGDTWILSRRHTQPA
jgi:hypothetical protein